MCSSDFDVGCFLIVIIAMVLGTVSWLACKDNHRRQVEYCVDAAHAQTAEDYLKARKVCEDGIR